MKLPHFSSAIEEKHKIFHNHNVSFTSTNRKTWFLFAPPGPVREIGYSNKNTQTLTLVQAWDMVHRRTHVCGGEALRAFRGGFEKVDYSSCWTVTEWNNTNSLRIVWCSEKDEWGWLGFCGLEQGKRWRNCVFEARIEKHTISQNFLIYSDLLI